MKPLNPLPPKLARCFLRWFLRDELAEEVEGDLEEQFKADVKERPQFQARLRYTYEVLNYLRLFAIRKKSIYPNDVDMFRNYFKVSWRNLTRHKMYSIIKIGGFGLGIAACLIIGFYIHGELNYDTFYANRDRIYRIVRETTFQNEIGFGANFPHPFASTIEDELPDVEMAGRYNAGALFGAGSNEVRRSDRLENFHEDKLMFADQSLLDILQVPFIQGNGKTALSNPNTMVITREKADKYFPGEDPLGKSFFFNDNEAIAYEITGVIQDFPANSHIDYDFIISLANREFYNGEAANWQNDNYYTYVLLRPGMDPNEVEKKMTFMVEKYFLPPKIESGNQEGIDWIKSLKFHLQPVDEIYLNTAGIQERLPHGDVRFVSSFGAIAAFILLIACINFINLSTARSANRAREVGLRKVVGSQRRHLIHQFLSESLLYSFLAFLAGLSIAWIFLPYFSALFDKSLQFPIDTWWFIPVMIGSIIIIGIIAGFYPALYLSAFKPIQVLKGNISRGTSYSSIRSSLVIFQFTITIVLIVGTIITHSQMHYILNKKLGFEKEQVLILQGTHTLGNKLASFKSELLKLPQVSSASVSNHLPVEGFRRNNGGWHKEGMLPEEAISGQQWAVDRDYVRTLGFRLVRGRDFSSEYLSDSAAVIINESLARELNFDDPIGQQISNYLGNWHIIGVVEDFHFESMKKAIRPLGMYIRSDTRAMAVKLNSGDMKNAINQISKTWKVFSPNQSIRYTFLDQKYAQMYQEVDRVGTMFTIFATLAIVIACLGLFALSTFLMEQRGKEISIRLVLGASVKNILQILTGNFVKLVVFAFLIAMPFAWFLMQRWLEDFVYKITVGWEVFLSAGLMAIVIALATIANQAIKTALMNPVENLRSE